ncbi:hypothetical protein P872_05615 [Rhodonellum psychrophilum GCM71 = DSM 17998]|uniref:Uncharacterized protein n=1 Tax=Rhodonellum psychrophilum GCM71 = DSM 17998 TaxID=1123057 RepID=U5BQR9_9BACT|nr:hypothetical protein P872_05615 [Rhodonellum psychrophilum GCM71 = DSM 17998]
MMGLRDHISENSPLAEMIKMTGLRLDKIWSEMVKIIQSKA